MMAEINENKPQSIDFDRLKGLTASLYFCSHLNQFQLGSVIFEVVEDENDGYRSSMSEVRIIKTDAPKNSGDLLAIVSINKKYDGTFDGYQLIDPITGHVWYEFGTSEYDDYYPCFVFRYTPIGHKYS